MRQAALGTVVLIENFGAGDELEIERRDGICFLVSMIAAAVPLRNDKRLQISARFANL